MANRYSNWQEDLSRELIKSKKRRMLFFNGLQEEYGDDFKALRAVVKVVGLKEYATLCGIKTSNLSNYLKAGKDLKLSTIEKLFAPLGVKRVNIQLNIAAKL